jgi:hypothetical protein
MIPEQPDLSTKHGTEEIQVGGLFYTAGGWEHVELFLKSLSDDDLESMFNDCERHPLS